MTWVRFVDAREHQRLEQLLGLRRYRLLHDHPGHGALPAPSGLRVVPLVAGRCERRCEVEKVEYVNKRPFVPVIALETTLAHGRESTSAYVATAALRKQAVGARDCQNRGDGAGARGEEKA